jgi:outer membrane receptor protein involved in Fe transport
LTLSENELKKYTEYDSDGNPVKLDGNPIAGFPDFLANGRMQYENAGFTATISMQHVGKQYTDNFGDRGPYESVNDENFVDPYTVFHGMLGYNFAQWLKPLSGLTLQLHIQNIFDTLYITHGEGNEFFPAAERHFFLNAKFEF